MLKGMAGAPGLCCSDPLLVFTLGILFEDVVYTSCCVRPFPKRINVQRLWHGWTHHALNAMAGVETAGPRGSPVLSGSAYPSAIPGNVENGS